MKKIICSRCKKEFADNPLHLKLIVKGASNCVIHLCDDCGNEFAFFSWGCKVTFNKNEVKA